MTENHWRSTFRQELHHVPRTLRLVNPPVQPVEDLAKEDRRGWEHGHDSCFETFACLDGGGPQTAPRQIRGERLRQSAGLISSIGRHDDSPSAILISIARTFSPPDVRSRHPTRARSGTPARVRLPPVSPPSSGFPTF